MDQFKDFTNKHSYLCSLELLLVIYAGFNYSLILLVVTT